MPPWYLGNSSNRNPPCLDWAKHPTFLPSKAPGWLCFLEEATLRTSWMNQMFSGTCRIFVWCYLHAEWFASLSQGCRCSRSKRLFFIKFTIYVLHLVTDSEKRQQRNWPLGSSAKAQFNCDNEKEREEHGIERPPYWCHLERIFWLLACWLGALEM